MKKVEYVQAYTDAETNTIAVFKDTGKGRTLYHVASLTEEPEPIITATFFTEREAVAFAERKMPGVSPDKGCRGISWM
jgi:hypothetical protein